jgi:hypothetical protein
VKDQKAGWWIPVGSFALALLLSALVSPFSSRFYVARAQGATTGPCTPKLQELKVHLNQLGGHTVKVTADVKVTPIMVSGTHTFKFHYFGPDGRDLGTATESEAGSTTTGTLKVEHKATTVPPAGVFGVKCEYSFTCTEGGSTSGVCATGEISNPPTPTKPDKTPLTVRSLLKAMFKNQDAKYDYSAVVTGGTGAITANIVVTVTFFFKADPAADFDDTLAFTETDGLGVFKFNHSVEPNGVPDGIRVTVKILATDTEGNQGFDSASDTSGFTRP